MLEVEGLCKTYAPHRGLLRLLVRSASEGAVEALRDVSLTVETGEIVGLLGANGAGKSTLIKAVTTLLEPDAGTIRLDGREVHADDPVMRRQIGLVQPDDRSHYWRMTGRKNLEFFGAMAGLSRPEAARRADEQLERRGLAHRDKLVFGYSSGMRAQLALARALLHDPRLVVLDEPTRSLDPVAAAAVCDDLRGLADEGRAVLLASHRLDEVRGLCDRVVILADGVVTWSGPTAQLGSDVDRLRASVVRRVGGTGR
ncbi:MAG: ABC transporter ATP-binding protein [Actinomycetota bacterium]